MSKGKVSYLKEFTKGIWEDNPVLVMLLGLCPTLAVTNTAINSLSMGLAVLFTLTSSSIVVSLIRKFVPEEVRIPVFIVVIATFVTIVDLFLKAQFPEISNALGPFVPLIVVNCMILGRQEAFASQNPLGRSILDALGMSVGFTLALLFLGMIRELLGSGTIFAIQVMPESFQPWVIMILPPGAFLTLGFMIAGFNWVNEKVKT